ncbi:MAG: hypothetical protein QOH18_1, partial [Solirubrobacterales bacterium]|nr:hypothetical protein [Solirubrobacterales bacterium]
LASLHFSEIPGAREALRRLGDMGLRLAIVSNWDVSLEEVLEMLDLRVLVDHVVTSAEVGHAKPDPRIFRYALQLLEVEACAAVHVGDSWELDVVGARNAHIRPVLVGERGRSVTTLHAIAELPNLLGEAK